jgi:hypothetical protein
MKNKMKMKKINYLCLALALCLGSCSKYNDQDALKQLIKAEALKPKLTADFVMQHFPCTEKIDTIVQTHTDYKYIDVVCPPADSTADTIYLDKIKVVTKNNVIKRTIALPSKTITITKYFEDSAKIKSLSLANSQTQAELKKCGEKKDKSSSLNLWLIICLCCSIIINLIQLRK